MDFLHLRKYFLCDEKCKNKQYSQGFKNQLKPKRKIKQNYILKIGWLYDLREFFYIFSQKEKSETKFKMKIKIKTNKNELIDFHEFSSQSKHFQKF